MPASPPEIYRFGDLTLDLVRGALRNGSGDLPLRRKSFDILTYFVTNAGRLLSKDELMQAAWPGIFVTEDSLVQCVREIRRALGEGGHVLIKTVPGRGYIFDAQVTAVEPAERATKESALVLPGVRNRWRGQFGWRVAAAAAVFACLYFGGGLSFHASSPAPPRLSIVVLPFINLSSDPDQEYFADGVTGLLTTDVARIEGSFVIARDTAFTYKGKTIDAKQIGRDLGVRYLLEGSVQRSADQIRINADLVDAETGSQLWAEAFDRERGDLFAIENEITLRIARALRFQLTAIEVRRAERQSTSADAMDYVMRGDVLSWRGETKQNNIAATAMYEKALDLDPSLPFAKISLADEFAGKALDDFSDDRDDDLRRAEGLVSSVLAEHPNYSYAHSIKAQILRARRRFDEAIVEYETAISLNPLEVSARNNLARAKILIGEPAAAIPLLEQAMQISPRDHLIGFIHYRLGLAHLLLGDTDEAIRWYRQALLTYYDPAYAYVELAAALSLKGDKASAQRVLAEAIELKPDFATIAGVKGHWPSQRPKYVELANRTMIEGLRRAGLREE
ncbi:MAG TPA: tetratricopeptide repeat protein [Stellaceae bacterium]|nr:tetratricopeptide repeat protein [Stellaceae bacterium]